jgi:hypothetical protein
MDLAQVRRLVPAMLVAAAAFLYANLFAFPATPFLLEGDQVYFWNFAQRMLGGEHVYRDFLQYTPPGTDLVYRAALGIFGVRIWLPNAMDLLLGVALCGVCFALARRIMDRGPALLATFLFLVWVFAKAQNGTHHYWSMLAILCAIVVADRSALATGALLGLSCFFTQTHGVFAFLGYGVFLVWTRRPWRSIALSAASFAVVLVALEAPYVADVGLAKLWYFEIAYPVRYVSGGSQHLSLLGLPTTWHNLPNLAQRALVDLMLPVVYVITLWRARTPEVRLIALIGAALFLEIALSPDWVRAYAVSMPAIILLVWWMPKGLRRCAWVVIAVLAVQQTIGRHRGIRTMVDVPAGRAATVPVTAEKLQWLAQHTQPGQYFFQATWPGFYMPLHLQNPAYLSEITQNESTRPEDVTRSVGEIEAKEVRYVLWSAYNDQPDPRYPSEDHVGALRAYLHAHYERVSVFSDRDEIWQRVAFRGATRDRTTPQNATTSRQ